MGVIAIIPARGGSKGIPGKNVKKICDKPLIGYTIEAAAKSKIFDRIIVSTDNSTIKKVSERSGAEVVIRPKKLATNTASTESAMGHVLDVLLEKEQYRPDVIVLLQPTSPLRTALDIKKAYSKFRSESLDSLLSVTSHVKFIWKETKQKVYPINYEFLERPRRQDMKDQFSENGAIYITKYKTFWKNKNRLGGKIGLYAMEEKHSIEVDSFVDLKIVEQYLSQ